ncbi:MAG TPA: GNAT family N-acetyltransferase [Steroidobacteraceae bacterium]|jgi:L-amino acid N-acyltransferase YncA
MHIRQATVADAQGIASVHVSSWQIAYRGIVPDTYLDALSVEARANGWREMLARGGPQEVWITVEDHDITGWAAFGPSRDEDASPATGELAAIYVSPQLWSTGIGRNLWHRARDRLKELGFKDVTLWVLQENARAIRFYRAAGFLPNELSQKQINRGGKNLTEIRFKTSIA